MPNKNYIKGRRQEYKMINFLESQGYLAFRSAGSHSPIDVIAIHPKRKENLLIQAKPKTMSKNARRKISDANAQYTGINWLQFFLVKDYDELVSDFNKREELKKEYNPDEVLTDNDKTRQVAE